MKITLNFAIACLIFGTLFSCSQVKVDDLDFLEGTWKVENKEQYEKIVTRSLYGNINASRNSA